MHRPFKLKSYLIWLDLFVCWLTIFSWKAFWWGAESISLNLASFLVIRGNPSNRNVFQFCWLTLWSGINETKIWLLNLWIRDYTEHHPGTANLFWISVLHCIKLTVEQPPLALHPFSELMSFLEVCVKGPHKSTNTTTEFICTLPTQANLVSKFLFQSESKGWESQESSNSHLWKGKPSACSSKSILKVSPRTWDINEESFSENWLMSFSILPTL